MITNPNWHILYKQFLKDGDRLEEIAKTLSFDVELYAPLRCLTHTMRKATIHEFAAKVKEISTVYGIPECVKESPVSDNRAPDLYAKWIGHLGEFTYRIELVSAEPDCPYDPDSEYEPSYYRSGKSRRLHAVCRNVLKELEDEVDDITTIEDVK